MSDDIFNSDWYKAFNQITMDDFLEMTGRFREFGLTREEIIDGIRSACAFFNIPMPRMIQDLTNVQGGQTMFVNWDAGRYDDDVLCFNIRQLVDMKVNSKDAFSLVMTHECAHRVLQATRFPGVNNGIWENELAADFLMGCRAGLWNMDISGVSTGLLMTSGSPTHPEGVLRAMFIRFGKYRAVELHRMGVPLAVQNLLNEFMTYRQQNLAEIQRFQRKFYQF